MARLREALEDAGFDDVRTHLHSGNVVLSSKAKPEQTARRCERLIEAEFGLEIDVVVHTPAELARVVEGNPLGEVATDSKRYQVSFLAGPLPATAKRKLEEAVEEPEELVSADVRSMRGTRTASRARSCGVASPGGAWASPLPPEIGRL
jgi:uncharacterized protein (DUF1697 family)